MGIWVLAAFTISSAIPAFAETEIRLSPLFVVLDKKLTQMDFQTDKTPSPEAEAFVKQARAFAKLSRNARPSCRTTMSGFPLCTLLGQAKTTPAVLESRFVSADFQRWESQIAGANFDAIRDISVQGLGKTLKQVLDWSSVRPAAEMLISKSKCLSTGTYMLFAMKAEEFFPDPVAKEMALALHEKATKCGDDEYSERSRFRRALMMISDGKCTAVELDLVKLSDNPDGEFTTRALYWRFICAQANGNEQLADLLKRRLYDDHPLSFHSLMASQGKGPEALQDLSQVEPMVQFRSKFVPTLNPWLGRVEWLQKAGLKELAMEILRAIDSDFDRAELNVQLYQAVLFERMGDQIGKFKVVSGIFKSDPHWISRQMLMLFYPLKRWDEIRRYQKKVDPYLAAALIRQESGFNEIARSPVGALGLMQLMFDTARRMERVNRRELLDARTNIRLGIRYLSSLLERYQGDVDLALAAYNAGPERVDDWKRRYTMTQKMIFLDLIPFRETRDYVALISRNYYWYMRLYGAGQRTGKDSL